jgi:hypothetical protein
MPQFSLGPLLRTTVVNATKTTKISPVSLAIPLRAAISASESFNELLQETRDAADAYGAPPTNGIKLT